MPARTSDQKSASVIAAGAGAEVVKVEAVEVHHLEDPVAILLDRRDGEDDGFGTQVKAEERVRSVGVGGHERSIGGSEDAGETQRGVEWAFVLRIALVNREGVHGEVNLHHGISVDISVFGDGADFCRRN